METLTVQVDPAAGVLTDAEQEQRDQLEQALATVEQDAFDRLRDADVVELAELTLTAPLRAVARWRDEQEERLTEYEAYIVGVIGLCELEDWSQPERDAYLTAVRIADARVAGRPDDRGEVARLRRRTRRYWQDPWHRLDCFERARRMNAFNAAARTRAGRRKSLLRQPQPRTLAARGPSRQPRRLRRRARAPDPSPSPDDDDAAALPRRAA